MIMWIMAGLVATFGALCYAEVGLLIPKSGGEYPIIYDSYGDIPGFLFAWVSKRLYVALCNTTDKNQKLKFNLILKDLHNNHSPSITCNILCNICTIRIFHRWNM